MLRKPKPESFKKPYGFFDSGIASDVQIEVPVDRIARSGLWQERLNRVFGLLLGGSDQDSVKVSPAMIIRSCLIDMGLVSYPGTGGQHTPCFVGSLPNNHDRAVAIYDWPGRWAGRRSDNRAEVKPGVLVKIRWPDYSNGYDYSQRMATALDTMGPRITRCPEDGNLHYILTVPRTSGITTLGEEVGTRRQLWTITAIISFSEVEPTIG